MRMVPKSPNDNEIGQMEQLWSHYARRELNVANTFEETHPELVPRTRLEEIWAWEDWALQHFVKAMDALTQPRQVA